MEEEFDSVITSTKIFRARAQGSLKIKKCIVYSGVVCSEGEGFFILFCHILIGLFSLFQADQLRTPARKAFVLCSSYSELKVPVMQGARGSKAICAIPK